MDSLSQFVLGASVAVAAVGSRTAAWKAALWGGMAGTLPDLDVLIDHGDALSNMVLHRAESHSLVWLTLASPVLGALPARLHGAGFRVWWLAMWLALVTHPLLDAMTVYGTQLLLPFTAYPFGVGSIFIIDPLYTVPLLAGVMVAVTRRSGRAEAWVHAGLALSTAYLAWSVVAQWHVRAIAQSSLASSTPPPAAILVTPTPFNTVLWRVVAMYPDGSYQEGFRSLLDGDRPIRWQRFDAPTVPDAVRTLPAVQRLARFSHGFYKVDTQGEQARVTDLRMGQEPNYTFSFIVADRPGEAWRPVIPRSQGSRGDVRRGLAWIWERMWGRDVPPPGAGAR